MKDYKCMKQINSDYLNKFLFYEIIDAIYEVL